MAISGSHTLSLSVRNDITVRSLGLKFSDALQPQMVVAATVRVLKDGLLLPDAAQLKDAGLADGCIVELLQTAGTDVVITACNDNAARIFSLDSGQCSELRGHFGQVYACSVSPDNRHLLTASEDKSARIWEVLGDAVVEKRCLRHAGEVYSAVFSHCGNFAVTASEDNSACLWRMDGTQRWTFSHNGEVYLSTFSCDDELVLTASEDGSAALIFAETGECQSMLVGHDSAVNRAEFSPDGCLVVTASLDATGRIWNRQDGVRTYILRGSRSEVKYASFSPDSKLVFLTHANGTAEMFCSHTGICTRTLLDHIEPVYMAVSCPNCRVVALASEDARATVWNITSGQKELTLEHADAVTWISFSRCGKFIVTTSWDCTAKLWYADSGECLDTLEGHASPVIYAEFATLYL